MDRPSLRERKKAAAMTAIQRTAMDLFERHGFDAVTVEQVAARSEVSPSTVYRYFGTKEGLVLHDQFDDVAVGAYLDEVAGGTDPAQALRAILDQAFGQHFYPDDEELTRRRTALWMEVPALRRAGLVVFDEVVEGLAVAIADRCGVSVAQARLAMSVTVWPLLAAIRNWHEEGGEAGAWKTHLQAAMATMPDRIPGWPATTR